MRRRRGGPIATSSAATLRTPRDIVEPGLGEVCTPQPGQVGHRPPSAICEPVKCLDLDHPIRPEQHRFLPLVRVAGR